MSKNNFQFSNFLFYRQNSSKKGVWKNGQHLTLHLGGKSDSTQCHKQACATRSVLAPLTRSQKNPLFVISRPLLSRGKQSRHTLDWSYNGSLEPVMKSDASAGIPKRSHHPHPNDHPTREWPNGCSYVAMRHCQTTCFVKVLPSRPSRMLAWKLTWKPRVNDRAGGPPKNVF